MAEVKIKARKGTRLALAALVASALLAPASLGSTPAFGCSSAPGPQRTLEVEGEALTKVVARGAVAKVEVKTYRPAQERFLDNIDFPPGVVPMQPAGDVPFTLGVLTGNGYVYQNVASATNADGVKVVKMRLEHYHKKGFAEVRLRAFVDHSPQTSSQCVEIQEYGYKEIPKAFKVT